MIRSAFIRIAIVISLSLVAFRASGQDARQPLPEASNSPIGYESVAEALEALHSKKGVVFSQVNGWLVATDEAAFTIWSFAPEGYPAYPAAVKRQVIPRGYASTIQMSVLCEAEKKACDDLVKTFADMNGITVNQ